MTRFAANSLTATSLVNSDMKFGEQLTLSMLAG
jgi:hypothetical protein